MTDDEWQALVTRRAGEALGQWLVERGRLHQPIRCLTMGELEALACTAIAKFVVMASQRIREEPGEHPELARLLLG